MHTPKGPSLREGASQPYGLILRPFIHHWGIHTAVATVFSPNSPTPLQERNIQGTLCIIKLQMLSTPVLLLGAAAC